MTFLKTIRMAAVGIAASAAMATAAGAATLSIVGGTPSTLPATYNPACNGCTAPSVGDPITVFKGSVLLPLARGGPGTRGIRAGGLYLSSNASLRYTFIGKEAGAKNAAVHFGGWVLTNTGGFNTSFTVYQSMAGLVQFLFQTREAGLWDDINGNGMVDTLSIFNGGISQFSGLSMAFSAIFNGGKSVYAFFGDGRGDVDYDDMVIRIDVVPLPAAGLMLAGALGGLGLMRRRRKARAA